MVQSGLVDDPRVSQFRLTAHLGLALAIFAAMLWAGFRSCTRSARPKRRWRGGRDAGRSGSPPSST